MAATWYEIVILIIILIYFTPSFLAALVNQWVRKNVPGLSLAFGSISLHQVALTRIHTRFPRIAGMNGRWLSINGGAAVRSLTWRLCRRGRPLALFVEGIAVRVRIGDAGPIIVTPPPSSSATTATPSTIGATQNNNTNTNNTAATFAETELRQRRAAAAVAAATPHQSVTSPPSLPPLTRATTPQLVTSISPSDPRLMTRQQRLQKWLLSSVVAPLTKMITVVVDDVHIIVQHGDAEFHLDDFGVAVALGEGASKHHHRFMVELAAFSMNILGKDPTLAMPTSVRFAASALLARPPLPKNAPPPLAFIRQLKFSADIYAPKYVPLGIDSVELTGPGMHFSLDPGHQLAPVIALLKVITTPQPSSITQPPIVSPSLPSLINTAIGTPPSSSTPTTSGTPIAAPTPPTATATAALLGPTDNVASEPPLHLIPKKISAKLDHLQLDIHHRSFFESAAAPMENFTTASGIVHACASWWIGGNAGAHPTNHGTSSTWPHTPEVDNIMELSMTEITVAAVVTGRDELDHMMQLDQRTIVAPLFRPNHVQWTGSIRTPRLAITQAPTLPIFTCEYVKVTGTGTQSVVMIAPAPQQLPQSLLHGRLAALSSLAPSGGSSDLLATPSAAAGSSQFRPTPRGVSITNGVNNNSGNITPPLSGISAPANNPSFTPAHRQVGGNGVSVTNPTAGTSTSHHPREHGLQTMHQIGLVLLTVRVNLCPQLAPWIAFAARTATTVIDALPPLPKPSLPAPIPSPSAATDPSPPPSQPGSPEKKHRASASFVIDNTKLRGITGGSATTRHGGSSGTRTPPFTTPNAGGRTLGSGSNGHSGDSKRSTLQRMVSRSTLDPFTPTPVLPSLPPIVNFSMKVMDTQIAIHPPPSWPGSPKATTGGGATAAAGIPSSSSTVPSSSTSSSLPSESASSSSSSTTTTNSHQPQFSRGPSIASANSLPSMHHVPMLLIIVSEVTLRLEEATSPTDGSAVQVVVLQVSELYGDLPREKFDPVALTTHSEEVLKSPGRFFSLNSATVAIGAPDVTLMADTVALRWSVPLMKVGPPLFALVMMMIPPLPKPKPSPSSASSSSSAPPPFVPRPPNTTVVKGSVNNIRVDFPYVLEFANDLSSPMPTNMDNGNGGDALAASFMAAVDNVTTAATAATTDTVSGNGDASATNKPRKHGSITIPARPLLPSRGLTLKTYTSDKIDIDVDMSVGTWCLQLFGTNCYNEGKSFLRVVTCSMGGKDRSRHEPKMFDIKANGIRGEWDPALQLGIFKLVKDCTATALTLKHGLFGTEYRDEKLIGQIPVEKFTAPDGEIVTIPSIWSQPNHPLFSLLAQKQAFVDSFRRWYHVDRASYLPEQYMHVKMLATDIYVTGTVNAAKKLDFDLKVDSFASSMIPHNWSFAGVHVGFMGQPFITCHKMTMDRIGITPDKVDNNGLYTEEQHTLADYLDLTLTVDGCKVEIAPGLDIGAIAEDMFLNIAGVVKSIQELPTLNTLSRRHGGPGYVGPPLPPDPGLLMKINDLSFELVDEPLTSWITHMHPLWQQERAEQERREHLLKVRKSLASSTRGPTTSSSSSSGNSSNPHASGYHQAIMSATELENMRMAINRYNSTAYYNRVEALKATLPSYGEQTLKRAPLLILGISTIDVAVGMDGNVGSFYDTNNVLRVIRNQHLLTDYKAARFVDDSEDPSLNRTGSQRSSSSPLSAGGNGARGRFFSPSPMTATSSTASSPSLPPISEHKGLLPLPPLHPPTTTPTTTTANTLATPPSTIDTVSPAAGGLPLAAAVAASLHTNTNLGTSSISPSAKSPSAAGARNEETFADARDFMMLTGRYMNVSTGKMLVTLRSFPAPLFASSGATINGRFMMAQLPPPIMLSPIANGSDGPSFDRPPSFAPSLSIGPSSASITTTAPSSSTTTSDAPTTMDSTIPLQPPPAASATNSLASSIASVGASPSSLPDESVMVTIGMHRTSISRRITPLHLFYDLDVSLGSAEITFSPLYMYALKDVLTAAVRLIPPLPPLYPLEPLTRANDRMELASYLHLGRAIAHGRANIMIKQVEMRLFSTPHVMKIDNYFRFRVESTEVAFDGKFLKLTVINAQGIQVPHRTSQPPVVDMPHMELHLGLQFLCTEEHFEANVPPPATAPSMSDLPDGMPTTPPAFQHASTLPSNWPASAATTSSFSIAVHPPLPRVITPRGTSSSSHPNQTPSSSSTIASTPATPAAPSTGGGGLSLTLPCGNTVGLSSSFSEGLNVVASGLSSAAAAAASAVMNVGSAAAATAAALASMPVTSPPIPPRRLSLSQGSSSVPAISSPPGVIRRARSPSSLLTSRRLRPPPLSSPSNNAALFNLSGGHVSELSSPTASMINGGFGNEPESPRPNGTIDEPFSLCPLIHECNVHMSLSVYFARGSSQSLTNTTPMELAAMVSGPDDASGHTVNGMGNQLSSAPLSVTLHSSSVAWLVNFGMFYAKMPPLPFPRPFRRTHQYPLAYIPNASSPPPPGDLEPPEPPTIPSTTRPLTFSASSSTRHLARRPILGTAGATPARAVAALSSITGAPIASAASLLDRSDGKRGGIPLPATPATTTSNSSNAALPPILTGGIPSNLSSLSISNGFINGDDDIIPLTTATNASTSSAIAAGMMNLNVKHETHIRICALYVESVIIESAALTIWEGQEDLGPARGLQLSVDLVYFSTEVAEESGLTKRPTDELRSPKIYLPMIAGMYWTVANTTIGIEGMSGQLVHNSKWRELVKQEQERERKLNNIIGTNRVVVHTYENERYSLGRGWSSGNLLPTDRSGWTNADGLQEIKKDSCVLPSDGWEWEFDWQLDFDLRKRGEVDEEGWEYAHDFPRAYSRVRRWYCNVRRRRWIRVRKLKVAGDSHSGHDSSADHTCPPELGGPGGVSAENFLCSLASVSLQQRLWEPPLDVEYIAISQQRMAFRRIGLRRSRQLQRLLNTGNTNGAAELGRTSSGTIIEEHSSPATTAPNSGNATATSGRSRAASSVATPPLSLSGGGSRRGSISSMIPAAPPVASATPPVVPARPNISMDLSSASGALSALESMAQPPPALSSLSSSSTIGKLDEVSRAVAVAAGVTPTTILGGLHGGVGRASASGSLLTFFDIAPPGLATHASLSPSHITEKKGGGFDDHHGHSHASPAIGEGKRTTPGRSRAGSRGDKPSSATKPKVNRVRSSLLNRRGSAANMRLRLPINGNNANTTGANGERKMGSTPHGAGAVMVHTLRVQDFKALITKDVRAACGTIIEQYAAALREVLITPNDIVKKFTPQAVKSKPNSPIPSPSPSPSVGNLASMAAATSHTSIPTSSSTNLYPTTPSVSQSGYITIEGLPHDAPVSVTSPYVRPAAAAAESVPSTPSAIAASHVDASATAAVVAALAAATAVGGAPPDISHHDGATGENKASTIATTDNSSVDAVPSVAAAVQLPGAMGPLMLRTSSAGSTFGSENEYTPLSTDTHIGFTQAAAASSSTTTAATGVASKKSHHHAATMSMTEDKLSGLMPVNYDRQHSFPHRPSFGTGGSPIDHSHNSDLLAHEDVPSSTSAESKTPPSLPTTTVAAAAIAVPLPSPVPSSSVPAAPATPVPPQATTASPATGTATPAKSTGSIKTMVASTEVQDWLLIEIINPQVCVHSEETRGRVLFKTMRLIIQARLHWRAPSPPTLFNLTAHQQRSMSALAAPLATVIAAPPSAAVRSQAIAVGVVLPTPPATAASVLPGTMLAGIPHSSSLPSNLPLTNVTSSLSSQPPPSVPPVVPPRPFPVPTGAPLHPLHVTVPLASPPSSPPLSPLSPDAPTNAEGIAAFAFDAHHAPNTTSVHHTNAGHHDPLATTTATTMGAPSFPAPTASGNGSPVLSRSAPVWPCANIEKVFISIGVEAIEAFVSPTDVDVNAGIVWMSEANHGLLKPIMQPASFMSSLTFRPYLFLPDHSPLYPSWAPPPRSSSPVPPPQPSVNIHGVPTPSATNANGDANPFSDGAKRADNDEMERGLNSVLIQLNILQFAMDAHQFALMVDVFKTVAAPLPYAGEGDEERKKEEVRAMKIEDLHSEVVMVNLARRRMEWALRHHEWMLNTCSDPSGTAAGSGSPPFGPIASVALERLALASTAPMISSPTPQYGHPSMFYPELNWRSITSPPSAVTPSLSSSVATPTPTPMSFSRQRGGVYQQSFGSMGGLGMLGMGKEDIWSMSRVEAATFQSNLQELVMEYAQLNEKFASLLLNVRLKNETLPVASIPIRNIQVELYVDSVCYSLVRNAQPWFNITVEGIAVSAVVFDDLSGEFTLEVRNISGRNLDYASKPNCREHAWADVILPLELKDDSWNDRNLMVNAHAVKRVINGRKVIPHLEANVYPLNIRLTYDTLFNIAAYFVYDQEKLTKEYTKHKTRFLPVSEVLDIDGPHKPSASDIHSAHRPGASPVSTAGSILNAIERGRLGTAFEMYKHRAQAIASEPDDIMASMSRDSSESKIKSTGSFASPTSQDRSLMTPTAAAAATMKKQAKIAEMDDMYEFTYIRLGRTRFVVSYLGNKQHNIEDFQGLVVRLRGFVYQRRISTLEKLGKRLRKDIIKNLLSQVGETLGSFLSYKLGMRKNHKKRVASVLNVLGHHTNDEKTVVPKNKDVQIGLLFGKSSATERKKKSKDHAAAQASHHQHNASIGGTIMSGIPPAAALDDDDDDEEVEPTMSAELFSQLHTTASPSVITLGSTGNHSGSMVASTPTSSFSFSSSSLTRTGTPGSPTSRAGGASGLPSMPLPVSIHNNNNNNTSSGLPPPIPRKPTGVGNSGHLSAANIAALMALNSAIPSSSSSASSSHAPTAAAAAVTPAPQRKLTATSSTPSSSSSSSTSSAPPRT